jgi:hypothetical protein
MEFSYDKDSDHLARPIRDQDNGLPVGEHFVIPPDGLLVSPMGEVDGGAPARLATDGDPPQAVGPSSGFSWPDGSLVYSSHIARRLEVGETASPAKYRARWRKADAGDVVALAAKVAHHLTYAWAGELKNPQPFHQRLALDAWKHAHGRKKADAEVVALVSARLMTKPLELARRLGLFEIATRPEERWSDGEGLWLDFSLAAELEVYGAAGRSLAETVRASARERWRAYEATGSAAELWRMWVDPEQHPAPARWFALVADMLLVQVVRDGEHVERAARATKPETPTRWPLAVDDTSIRVQTALSGGRMKGDRRGDLETTGPGRMTIRWADGAQVELDFYQGHDPLTAVARKYGPYAVRHLQTALYLHHMSHREPLEGFPWWPDEHAIIQGSTTRGHRDLFAMLEKLAGAELSAHLDDGEQMAAPILMLTNRLSNKRGDTIAASMNVHPALSRGVYGPGRKAWWPQPVELLKLDPSIPGERDVFALVILMGEQWNVERGKKRPTIEAKRTTKGLYEALAHHWRAEGTRDTRAGERLDACFQAAKWCGALGDYEVSGGDLSDPDAVVVMRPAVEMLQGPDRATGIRRGPQIPATGRELARWVHVRTLNGETLKAIAEGLQVTPRTLRDGVKRDFYQLGAGLRRALLDYLHPGITDPPDRKLSRVQNTERGS